MQGSIDAALSLVTAGNAFLRGEDITGFWPDAQAFIYTKTCEFRTPPEDESADFLLAAADPLEWFASLRSWCRGLRLHNSPAILQQGQLPGLSERMSVAFVGGGPRWLVEAVGEDRSELWESFQRFGERDDPQQKIWLTTWLRQGAHSPFDADAIQLPEAVEALREVLPEIAGFARKHDLDNFAGLFDRSLRILDGGPLPDGVNELDLCRYGRAADDVLRAYAAVGPAWVFGGMGSWNDLGGVPDPYEELSERLFRALCDVVCGAATATFRG